jgi:hypothetical protein
VYRHPDRAAYACPSITCALLWIVNNTRDIALTADPCAHHCSHSRAYPGTRGRSSGSLLTVVGKASSYRCIAAISSSSYGLPWIAARSHESARERHSRAPNLRLLLCPTTDARHHRNRPHVAGRRLRPSHRHPDRHPARSRERETAARSHGQSVGTRAPSRKR